jgi:prepilin-type N-terminal cleavage/methylation domain-containing protein
MTRIQFPNKRLARGFSLVELMVGLTISLIILAAVAAVFVQSRITGRAIEDAQVVAEGARFALDRVGFALRMAKHAGCMRGGKGVIGLTAKSNGADDITNATTGLESAKEDASDALRRLLDDRAFLRGFDGGAGFAISGATTLTLATGSLSAGLPAPDVLYTAGAGADFRHLAAGMAAANVGTITTVGRIANNTNSDLYMISDCVRGELFYGTPDGAGTTVAYDTTQNHTATLRRAYAADASIAPFDARNYFVARANAAAEFARDGWTLYEQRLESAPGNAYRRWGTPQPIVSRVVRFNAEYGVDLNNDGVADQYMNAAAVGNAAAAPRRTWGSVVSVRIALGIQGEATNTQATAAGTFSGREVQTYTSQTEIRN